jgi:hypothetical protein
MSAEAGRSSDQAARKSRTRPRAGRPKNPAGPPLMCIGGVFDRQLRVRSRLKDAVLLSSAVARLSPIRDGRPEGRRPAACCPADRTDLCSVPATRKPTLQRLSALKWRKTERSQTGALSHPPLRTQPGMADVAEARGERSAGSAQLARAIAGYHGALKGITTRPTRSSGRTPRDCWGMRS